MLQEIGNGQGYLKAGFLGFAGTGKTHTATLLACGLREHLKLNGKIAFFDTEGGAEYVAPMVRKLTGSNPVGVKSRSLDDLMKFGKECVEAGDGVSVVIADSMSHIWDDVRKSYMATINSSRQVRGLGPRTKLEFQDWGPIKDKFAQWTEFFLNSPLHIIVCGRAGFTYDYNDNEETGKKELVKTGVKMRTEAEFGFEPSLLCEMDKEQERDGGKLSSAITITATVIKDRFNQINGRQFRNPTFESFLPHVQCLTPGVTNVVDTKVKTIVDVDDSGDAQFARERKARAILSEEINGELTARWPGQSKEEKQAKSEALNRIFNTRSWTAIENMDSGKLRAGLASLRDGDVPSVAKEEPLPVGANEAF